MLPLNLDITNKKESLGEFYNLTSRILDYLPNVLTNYKIKNNYRIYYSESAGTIKYLRPINFSSFYIEKEQFAKQFILFKNTLLKIKNRQSINLEEKENIDKVLYTIQQSIGISFDLLINANSARKHVGNRFEELIKVVFDEIGITNIKTVVKIPYETIEGQKIYRCENDLILSPFPIAKSTSVNLNKNEVVVSIKTSSKDRMGKIFIDKILLEKFIGHKQKVIGIFLNDVQRKKTDNISFTLVGGLFMVYTKFLTQLDGIYYLDPPPQALANPFNQYMFKFSKLITEDIYKLLTP